MDSGVRAGGPPGQLPLAALIVVVAATLAGCGSSTNGITAKSAAEILAVSRAAALDSTSVRVRSTSAQGRVTRAVSLELAIAGARARISFLGRTREVIRIGDVIYAKASRAFYRRLEKSSGQRISPDTWLKRPAGTGTPPVQVDPITDLSSELALLVRADGPLAKGATTTLDGQKVVELKEQTKLFAGSLFIAATGTPYPIEIVKHGRETGQTTFSGWNQPVTLTAPANAVQLSQLEHGARRRRPVRQAERHGRVRDELSSSSRPAASCGPVKGAIAM